MAEHEPHSSTTDGKMESNLHSLLEAGSGASQETASISSSTSISTTDTSSTVRQAISDQAIVVAGPPFYASAHLSPRSLEELDGSFSFSTYLSPAVAHLSVARDVIFYDSQPIDGALLICLALNEECRKLRLGAFFHLPLRENHQVGHASDLLFGPKIWTDQDKLDWDVARWVERLDLFKINKNCYDKIFEADSIIPICGRILQFQEPSTHQTPSAAYHLEGAQNNALPNYAGSDSAVRPGEYRYSRPMQDLSSYLLLYPSLHTPPLLCSTRIFEGEVDGKEKYCTRRPTPNDLSETFTLNHNPQAIDLHARVAKKMSKDSKPRHLKAGKPGASNADVVRCLLKAWDADAFGAHTDEMVRNGDKVRYMWQELKNMMETGPETRVVFEAWPKK